MVLGDPSSLSLTLCLWVIMSKPTRPTKNHLTVRPSLLEDGLWKGHWWLVLSSYSTMNMHANFALVRISSLNAGISLGHSLSLRPWVCFQSPHIWQQQSTTISIRMSIIVIGHQKCVYFIIPTESIIIRSFAPPHHLPWSACCMAGCTKETGSSCFLRGNFLALRYYTYGYHTYYTWRRGRRRWIAVDCGG